MDKEQAVELLRKVNSNGGILNHRNIITITERNEIADFIEQQDQELEEAEKSARIWRMEAAKLSVKQEEYAELGRLALATRANLCSSSDFQHRNINCENHCTNYPYCKLRAELLVEGRVNG